MSIYHRQLTDAMASSYQGSVGTTPAWEKAFHHINESYKHHQRGDYAAAHGSMMVALTHYKLAMIDSVPEGASAQAFSQADALAARYKKYTSPMSPWERDVKKGPALRNQPVAAYSLGKRK